MTATNMCSNFGGKWDSTPKEAIYGLSSGIVLDILMDESTRLVVGDMIPSRGSGIVGLSFVKLAIMALTRSLT